MIKILENLEALREDIFHMHCTEIFHRRGHNEFSYILFYDTETGEFTEPYTTDSFNDSAATTTQTIAGEEALYVLEQMQANPNLVRVWGHSHANGGVSPSGQDIRTILEDNQEISVISNNKGDLNLLLLIEGEIYETKKSSANTYVAQVGNTVKPANTYNYGRGQQQLTSDSDTNLWDYTNEYRSS